MIIALIALLGVGILSLIFGYLIKYKQKVNLINFYNESKVLDKKKFTDWVGNHLLYLSGLNLIFAFIVIFTPDNTITWLLYTVVTILIIVRLTIGLRKYYS